jgi:hypothetical protein
VDDMPAQPEDYGNPAPDQAAMQPVLAAPVSACHVRDARTRPWTLSEDRCRLGTCERLLRHRVARLAADEAEIAVAAWLCRAGRWR